MVICSVLQQLDKASDKFSRFIELAGSVEVNGHILNFGLSSRGSTHLINYNASNFRPTKAT